MRLYLRLACCCTAAHSHHWVPLEGTPGSGRRTRAALELGTVAEGPEHCTGRSSRHTAAGPRLAGGELHKLVRRQRNWLGSQKYPSRVFFW